MAYPRTLAMTGFGASRIAAWMNSTGAPIMPRPCRSDFASPVSPPTQKARDPAPVNTMAPISRFQAAICSASASSS